MKSNLLAFFLLASVAVAQPRHVRFLAVGDAPPFRQEIRDGVSYELEPPEGSIPPREVLVGGEAAALRLGMIGPRYEVPAGAGRLELRKREFADETPWLSIDRPETGDFLVLVWRDPSSATWAQARAKVLPEDAASAPANSVRFVNVSPFAVRAVIGVDRVILAPGEMLVREVPVAGLPIEMHLQERTGKLRRMFSSTVGSGAGERSLVVIYRADGHSPRRPIKVMIRRETVFGEEAQAR